MLYGYGFTFYNADINKVLEFLKDFPEDYAAYQRDMRRRKIDECNESCLEWFETYEVGLNGIGLAAFFAGKVNEAEDLNLSTQDDMVYLAEGMPWEFTETERKLTISEMDAIFYRWLERITDDYLEIGMLEIPEDDD